jgi:hypothetical protein
MYIERLVLTLTVNASGDATVYSPTILMGRVLQLRYVPDASDALATGADLTITGETTGVAVATLANIGTSAFTRVPRQATHGADGSASLYAVGGEPVEEPVYLAGERLKVVVAEGGVSKTGTLHVLIG